jgi:hypothetical protein
MSTHPTTANHEQTQRIVRGYHDAWTAGEVDAAGVYLADVIVNPAPFNHFSLAPLSRADYLAFLREFRQRVTGVDLISALYGDEEATLVYEVHTATPAGARTFPTAEHFRITNGRIAKVILIFNAAP